MNNVRPFIPKQDNDLPDSYKMTIAYVTGKSDVFETTQHKFIEKSNTLEIVTIQDEWFLIPLSSIIKISFDKDFSKMVAIRQKQESVEKENNAVSAV